MSERPESNKYRRFKREETLPTLFNGSTHEFRRLLFGLEAPNQRIRRRKHDPSEQYFAGRSHRSQRTLAEKVEGQLSHILAKAGYPQALEIDYDQPKSGVYFSPRELKEVKRPDIRKRVRISSID